ncbi:uncharacterized protein MKK02DRAFT_8291, partial [Dioszegia hungarica]
VSLSSVSPALTINSDAYTKLTRLLPKVLTNAVAITDKSWELGALVQSLLEVYNPELTAFGYDASSFAVSIPWDAMKVAISSLYAVDWSGAPSDSKTTGDIGRFLDWSSPTPLQPRPLVGGDGALGDPAALGPSTYLLAQYAGREDVRRLLSMRSKEDYAWAVGNQMAYLSNGIKSSNGTISQREGHFELWADMGYMIPPLPAYIGLATDNIDQIRSGLNQWSLEASALLDPNDHLFRHVHYWDSRYWATGQAWMLGGAMRVIASAHTAGFATQLADQIAPIEEKMAQVFYAIFGKLDSHNLVPNYMNEPNPELSHGDTAGTALIIAAFYRYYLLYPSRINQWALDQADKAFKGVVDKIDESGWVTQVVDPDGTNGFLVYINLATPMQSPEAQAFSGMMWAARTAAG